MNIILVHQPFNWRKPLTAISHLIRKFAGVYNNHGAFIIDGNIYESDINGVVCVKPEDWLKGQTITVYDLNTSHVPRYPTEAFAKSLVKKHKYDFLSLFVFQPIYLATGWYIGPKNRAASKRFYCFEYLAYVLGIKNWYKITPKEFNNWCDKYMVKTHSNVKAKDYFSPQTN